MLPKFKENKTEAIIPLTYVFENIRKGKRRIALINLKTSSMLNPTILKGSRRSQTKGKRTSRMSATGQHITSRIHQRITEMKSFIGRCRSPFYKRSARLEMWISKQI
jgi:hypothetical protein